MGRRNSSRSAPVLRSGGCNAFAKTGLTNRCLAEGVLRPWRSIRGRFSHSSARNAILHSMRLFRRFTSGESQEVVARCPASSPVMASPSKKSLRAAERKRADVARARRRWIREQGFLDPAHLVFIDETAVTRSRHRCIAAKLFDHLVGAGEQHRRHGQAERLRCAKPRSGRLKG